MAEAVIIIAALALGWPLLRGLRRASRRGSNPAPPKPQPHGGRLEPGEADLAHTSREMLRRLEQLERGLRWAHQRIDMAHQRINEIKEIKQ